MKGTIERRLGRIASALKVKRVWCLGNEEECFSAFDVALVKVIKDRIQQI